MRRGDKAAVDHGLASVTPEQFEAALILSGGAANPDAPRPIPRQVSLVKHFVTNWPMVAICNRRRTAPTPA
jgi:DJ-1/PfpI family